MEIQAPMACAIMAVGSIMEIKLVNEGLLPLAHEVFVGNTNDVSCFHQAVDELVDTFKIDKIILVGDLGMISQKNLDYLHNKNYQYISGLDNANYKKFLKIRGDKPKLGPLTEFMKVNSQLALFIWPNLLFASILSFKDKRSLGKFVSFFLQLTT